LQVVAERPFGRWTGKPGENIAETPFGAAAQDGQDLPLTIRQAVLHLRGRDIFAGPETHHHVACLDLELRFRLACLAARIDDLQRAASLAFDQAGAEERVRYRCITRHGYVNSLQVLHGDA
jgi:hypothetical protein